MKKNTKRIIIFITIILLCLGGYRLYNVISNHFKNKNKVEETNIIPVKAIGAAYRNLSLNLEFTGNIVGTQVVNAFSQVPGKIHEINVKEGQKVYKGQTLMTVNRDIVGMEYKLSPIEAPINGYIGSITANKGMTVAPTIPLAEVVNMQQVEAVIKLMEEDINRINVGQIAEVKVAAYSDKKFIGKVYKKSAVLDQTSRTQEARIMLDNPQMQLRHGMFADIIITTNRISNVLAIPEDTIITDGETKYVMIVVNDKAQKKDIQTGETLSGYTIVKSGLNPGDVVITLGHENVREGNKLLVYREDENSKK